MMAALIAVTALAGLLAGACGGGGESSGSASSSPQPKPKTYTNETYRFSLTYDSSQFTETSDTSTQGGAGSSGVFSIGFMDPNGTKSGDVYRDGTLVTVYKLNTTVTESMLPLVKTELEKLLPQLATSLGSDTTMGTLAEADVNGTKGYTTDATYTMDGTPFKARLYFLINGELEYQVSMQAAETRWTELEPKFQEIIDSFKATPPSS
jgi:hypothetical protein